MQFLLNQWCLLSFITADESDLQKKNVIRRNTQVCLAELCDQNMEAKAKIKETVFQSDVEHLHHDRA